MKFVLVSDVHVDLVQWHWDSVMDHCNSVDTLLIAGDISNSVSTTSRWLVEAKQRFKNVIWVAGNHDFYNCDFHTTKIVTSTQWSPPPYDMTEMLAHYEKWSTAHGIHFLHRNLVEIEGVKFVGTTGWHDFSAGQPWPYEVQVLSWYQALSDTRIVWNKDRIQPNHRNPLIAAQTDAAWLANAVNTLSSPSVIVTHHLPSSWLKWDRPSDIMWTKLHGCFVNTLLENIHSEHIKYWCYGHTHQRQMKRIKNIEYVCNARGYQHENPNWTPIILEV